MGLLSKVPQWYRLLDRLVHLKRRCKKIYILLRLIAELYCSNEMLCNNLPDQCPA